jgi:hypothetical protein
VGFSLPAPEKLMNEHLTCWLLRYLRSSSALQGQGDDGFFFELKLFFSGMKKKAGVLRAAAHFYVSGSFIIYLNLL